MWAAWVLLFWWVRLVWCTGRKGWPPALLATRPFFLVFWWADLGPVEESYEALGGPELVPTCWWVESCPHMAGWHLWSLRLMLAHWHSIEPQALIG